MAEEKTPAAEDGPPLPQDLAYELPADWAARHPAMTYPDETPAQHAARLRALADGVPAKRERFLALADERERDA